MKYKYNIQDAQWACTAHMA